MPLYALHLDQLIHAEEAPDRGNYRCLECRNPMQVRQGRRRRHFYHIKTTPSCRLYSKSEDHLLLQLQIQSLFPKGEIFLEHPFLSIGRMADACWERHQLIFEVQCSLMTKKESEERIKDYGSLGYKIVWLLDDRLFNRRYIRPAETFLRENICYYIHYRKMDLSLFYDQFELLQEKKRLKKGSKVPVTLTSPRQMPKTLGQEPLPQQILSRNQSWPLFFEGDLIHKALLSKTIRPLAVSMQNWLFWEHSLSNETNVKKWALPTWFTYCLYRFFEWVLDQIND